MIFILNTTKSNMSMHIFSAVFLLFCCCSSGFSEVTGPDEKGDHWHRYEKREGPVEICHRNKQLKVVNANHYSVDIAEALPHLKTDWDILLLPEVRLPRERGYAPQQVRNYSYPKNPNLWGYYVALNDDVWNVVLFKSKLNVQINEVKLQPLPKATGDEYKGTRNGLYIDLNIGKLNLIIISTHLSWGTTGFTDENNINFIVETAEKYQDKNLIFGGAMNTKASAVKDKVRAAGYNIFPVDLVTVFDEWGWACSEYLISNLDVIDRDVEETFISPHNTVWVTYAIPKVEKYNSNNFANENTKFKNSLNFP